MLVERTISQIRVAETALSVFSENLASTIFRLYDTNDALRMAQLYGYYHEFMKRVCQGNDLGLRLTSNSHPIVATQERLDYIAAVADYLRKNPKHSDAERLARNTPIIGPVRKFYRASTGYIDRGPAHPATPGYQENPHGLIPVLFQTSSLSLPESRFFH